MKPMLWRLCAYFEPGLPRPAKRRAIPDMASAPIPKFASYCGDLSCELRNQRSSSNLSILVPLLYLKFVRSNSPLVEHELQIGGTSHPISFYFFLSPSPAGALAPAAGAAAPAAGAAAPAAGAAAAAPAAGAAAPAAGAAAAAAAAFIS